MSLKATQFLYGKVGFKAVSYRAKKKKSSGDFPSGIKVLIACHQEQLVLS